MTELFNSSYDLTPSYIFLSPNSREIVNNAITSAIVPSLAKYNSPQGYLPLINKIIDLEQVPNTHSVIITNSSTEALYLLLQSLHITELFFEEPCYFGLLRQIKSLHITKTNFHDSQNFYFHTDFNAFPHSISPLNKTFKDQIILDDSPYGLLGFHDKPKPNYTLSSNYFRIGSFSKILGPNLRLGYIILPNNHLNKVKHYKININLSSSLLLQQIALTALNNKIVESQTNHYCMQWEKWKNSKLPFLDVKGGLLTRLDLTKPTSFFSKAARFNILLEDSSYSYLSPSNPTFTRLNFSGYSSSKLFDFLYQCLS